ncbi:MAG: ribonuclease III [Gammaproteobacteria bacterium]
MKETLSKLCEKINYSFSSVHLLNSALTHRSAGKNNNERLEFLGDSILNFIIADALFLRFPDATEGQLSRIRAHLVKGETLAKIAIEIKVGNHLILGQGEKKSGGYRRDSILAGAMEAIIGAAYIDGGFEKTQQMVLDVYKDYLSAVSPGEVTKDPKTRLQEYLQSKQLALPVYDVKSVAGSDHAQHFTVACYLEKLENPFHGEGGSRRKAEQDAASKALEFLEKNN